MANLLGHGYSRKWAKRGYCPTCEANPGESCVNMCTKKAGRYHPEPISEPHKGRPIIGAKPRKPRPRIRFDIEDTGEL